MKSTVFLAIASYALVSYSPVDAGQNANGASGYAVLSASRGVAPRALGNGQFNSGYGVSANNEDDGDTWNNLYGNLGSWDANSILGNKIYYSAQNRPYRRSYLVNRPYSSRYGGLEGSLLIPRTLAMNQYGRGYFNKDPSKKGIINNWKSWRKAGGPLEEFGADYFQQHPSRRKFIDRANELRKNGFVWPFTDGAFNLPSLARPIFSGSGKGSLNTEYNGSLKWEYKGESGSVEPGKPNGYKDPMTPIRAVQPVHPPNFNNAPIVIPIPQRSGIPPLFATKVDQVTMKGANSVVNVIRPILRVETPKHPDRQPWMAFTTDSERYRIVGEGDYGSTQRIVGPMEGVQSPFPIRPGTYNPGQWSNQAGRYPGQSNWNYGYYDGPADQGYDNSEYDGPRMGIMEYNSVLRSRNNRQWGYDDLYNEGRTAGPDFTILNQAMNRRENGGNNYNQRLGTGVRNVGELNGVRPIIDSGSLRKSGPSDEELSIILKTINEPGNQSSGPPRFSGVSEKPGSDLAGKDLVFDDEDD
ncbi:hypothetical protein K7432_009206 [Basidiobolus ranarum]|uniref:Uncharacterized protein n=1 Tax=Basidiobolus ranarum TaxID=34480 RepID=A0ABR2VXF6_9FUNG